MRGVGSKVESYLSGKFDDPRGRNDEIAVRTQFTHLRETLHREAVFFVVIRRLAPGATEGHDFLCSTKYPFRSYSQGVQLRSRQRLGMRLRKGEHTYLVPERQLGLEGLAALFAPALLVPAMDPVMRNDRLL